MSGGALRSVGHGERPRRIVPVSLPSAIRPPSTRRNVGLGQSAIVVGASLVTQLVPSADNRNAEAYAAPSGWFRKTGATTMSPTCTNSNTMPSMAGMAAVVQVMPSLVDAMDASVSVAPYATTVFPITPTAVAAFGTGSATQGPGDPVIRRECDGLAGHRALVDHHEPVAERDDTADGVHVDDPAELRETCPGRSVIRRLGALRPPLARTHARATDEDDASVDRQRPGVADRIGKSAAPVPREAVRGGHEVQPAILAVDELHPVGPAVDGLPGGDSPGRHLRRRPCHAVAGRGDDRGRRTLEVPDLDHRPAVGVEEGVLEATLRTDVRPGHDHPSPAAVGADTAGVRAGEGRGDAGDEEEGTGCTAS